VSVACKKKKRSSFTVKLEFERNQQNKSGKCLLRVAWPQAAGMHTAATSCVSCLQSHQQQAAVLMSNHILNQAESS
jgi:hypothetical protein